jgi:cell division protein FtsI/penicillin-binding protein 2
MTIGAWIGFVVVALILIIVGLSAGVSLGEGKAAPAVVGTLCGVIASVLVLSFMLWYFGSTEKGKRAMKTQESNLNGGIERTVKVYDINGEIVAEYEGKFDVDHNQSRIIFDDENGKRHIIYYNMTTVIIDEK